MGRPLGGPASAGAAAGVFLRQNPGQALRGGGKECFPYARQPPAADRSHVRFELFQENSLKFMDSMKVPKR